MNGLDCLGWMTKGHFSISIFCESVLSVDDRGVEWSGVEWSGVEWRARTQNFKGILKQQAKEKEKEGRHWWTALSSSATSCEWVLLGEAYSFPLVLPVFPPSEVDLRTLRMLLRRKDMFTAVITRPKMTSQATSRPNAEVKVSSWLKMTKYAR